jgi:hypothetical protein
LNVRVILTAVVDLTDVNAAHVPLNTNALELTGDWRGYQTRSHLTSVSEPMGTAPPQDLGKAIFDTGAEGFRALSAKVSCNRTLFVFPDNLHRGSSVTYSDPHVGVVHKVHA